MTEVSLLLTALPSSVVLVAGGRIVEWNPAAEVLYGHQRLDVVDASFSEVLCDPVDAAEADAVLAAAEQGRSWEGDFRVRRRDGAYLVTSFRAAPITIRGRPAAAWIATDVVDQHQAEHERAVLLSAEHAARTMAEEALGLLEAVLAAAPVGIAVLDLDLRFVRVNDALARITGLPPDEHIGRRMDEVASMPAEMTADLRRVITTGRTLLGREVAGETPAEPGVRRHFLVNYYPVPDSSGELARAGVTFTEVTAAKRAEVERAQLLERAEAAQHRLAVLATASTVLTTTIEVVPLLERLARVLAPGVGDLCVIMLIDGAGHVEHVAAAYQDRSLADTISGRLAGSVVDLEGPSPIASVLRSGRARLVRGQFVADILQPLTGVRSVIVTPVEARGQVFGVLALATQDERDLGDEDVDLAVEVAHRAALALGNARAYEQERRVAETLQRALLPGDLPVVPGLDVGARYLAATAGVDVGGDWYDVVPLASGRTGLVIGDVVGHDVRAASAMGQLRNALRAYLWEHEDPAETVARVDGLITHLDLSLATCVVCVADVGARTLTWVNAGHPPPLLVPATRDESILLDDGHRVILGAGVPVRTESGTLRLQPGDTVALYTDGLIERRGESLNAGFERLIKASSVPRAGSSADALCDHLLGELVPGQERDDDVAVLVARFLPWES